MDPPPLGEVARRAGGASRRREILPSRSAHPTNALMTKPTILVAAAALIDVDGRVLICQRPQGKQLAGLWEFPGGKVEAGETPEDCLIRELDEELGIKVTHACLAP